MKNILYVALLLIITFSCKKETTKEETTTKIEKINELVNLYSEYGMINGAVLIANQGKVIHKSGLGLANKEWDIPNSVDTKFQIASLTKMFTATLILQLVAENKLELQQTISNYLPDFPKENGNQITIHHLLSHTSGIGRDPSNKEKYNRPKAMVNQFANVPLEFKPGKRFKYSNSGYTLLGYLIETITEQSYEEALQERIFKPLKMKNSGYFTHRKLIKNMASGYNKGFADYQNSDSTDESTAYAAGAIYSTVEDLFLWDQALLTEKILQKKYRDLLLAKHSIDTDEGGHYGYGFELKTKPVGNTSETVETIGHSGSISGFRALYTRIPSTNASIILLNNTSRAFFMSFTTAITGVLQDQSYDFPYIPLAQFMVKTIENEGIDKGIQFYLDHKDNPKYHVSEQELIVAGYRFLHNENPKTAAKIFKLATEVFPNQDNPFDSYAEALMTLGKNDEAIINYKKSLALNPKNDNAIKMLKTLGITYSTDLLNTNNWGKELFAIPLHFAPDIELKGFEDARFPKGWNDTKCPNFWTYAFAWKVNVDKPLTQIQVEDYLKKYYDGLLSGVNKEKNLVLPKTTVEISQNEAGVFVGNITIYDTFVTRKPLVLNFNIEQILCDNKNQSIILFRLSPKDLNHNVWKDLMEISAIKSNCE